MSKFALVFSTLFGVVEYASAYPGELPDSRKYTKGTFAYCPWGKQWYMCGTGIHIKTRKEVPCWKPQKEHVVPKKYLMTVMVYPT